jgi:hypothetical protein
MKKIFVCASLLISLSACGSEDKKPDSAWTQQVTRTVDNGYIVYVEHADSGSEENARFKAEGLALEDLANECSIIPKGTRIEDRSSEQTKYGYKAYVKLAVEFQECDQASKTVDPEQIKKLANVPFTQEMKRYQDYAETGQVPPASEVAQIVPPDRVLPAPAQNGWNDQTQFYVTRQYVAYQKEVVVLAPPTAYQPGTPQTQNFVQTIRPVSENLQQTMAKEPTYRTQPVVWSQIPNRPEVARPATLQTASHAEKMRGLMARPHQMEHELRSGEKSKTGKKRRKQNFSHER